VLALNVSLFVNRAMSQPVAIAILSSCSEILPSHSNLAVSNRHSSSADSLKGEFGYGLHWLRASRALTAHHRVTEFSGIVFSLPNFVFSVIPPAVPTPRTYIQPS
jgi:hypothetical protein